jgi:glutamate N-acetyltransferase/amino-acid N-acetyltransferase
MNDIKYVEHPITEVENGVCAPQGFLASGIHCGIRKNKRKKDLALIFSATDCDAAAVYTKNQVKAAPIYVTMAHLADGKARGIIANSGNANACARNGEENARRMAEASAAALGIKPEDMIVASTGVIGVPLEIEPIESGMGKLVQSLSAEGSTAAAEAIMTTDTFKKEYALSFSIGGKEVRIGGISKGSGMIHPNMGTTLNFLTTDASIDQRLLQKALGRCVDLSFNRISVDGDTSTNDIATILANGQAGNDRIEVESTDYERFCEALLLLCIHLARELARDGEGATRLLACTVSGAETEEKAEQMAKAVIGSSLTKTAMFGGDANWGRVLCAMGYSGATFDYETVNIRFRSATGEISVCEKGRGLPFDESLAKLILSADEIEILADLAEGHHQATCWGCDLTYKYVKINGDYRS